MKIESTEQIRQLNLCDASLAGIIWQNDRDISFNLSLSDKSLAIVTCSYFQNLKIELDFGTLTNSLTWDVEIVKSDSGIWHILFDFGGAPTGFIELDCNEIDLETT